MGKKKHRRASVLLVEDDVAVQRVLASMLAPAGYRLTACIDGKEALAKARSSGPFDVVVSDVSLPDLFGPKLIERLRQFDPTLRALLISGGEPLDSELPFLSKPFSAADLRAKLKELLAARNISSKPD